MDVEQQGVGSQEQKIRIECQGAGTLALDVIEPFQGGLKKRGKVEIDQIATSILTYGFSFPFFIWRHEGHMYCLDGHGRILGLQELGRRGYDLPDFPVCYIEARDELEAKQKLLRNESRYGLMTVDTVLEFMDGIEIKTDEISLAEGTLLITPISEVDIASFFNTPDNTKKKTPRVCPHCGKPL